MRRVIGLASLFLVVSASGCATSQPTPPPEVVTAEVPSYLLHPLPAPPVQVKHNRDLLQLLADYESLRRRANADRAAVVDLLGQPRSAGDM
ncbi:Rz1-like lysis system protein LysC [Onishia taeanensis]|nr:hypothetical protein [Halomonas taeanensis]